MKNKDLKASLVVILVIFFIPISGGIISIFLKFSDFIGNTAFGRGLHSFLSPVYKLFGNDLFADILYGIMTFIGIVIIIAIPIAFIIFIVLALKTLNSLFGIKGGTPKEIYNSIIENDISKAADKIMFYQNNAKDMDIAGQLKIEHKKINKTKFFFLPIGLNKDPWAFFNIPKDMEIKEENNEIIIYYKNFVYNVNKGKYI
ncbi:MAG: hypothetical protein FWD40_09165 [Treponema sp.]|nr:hypothetical protein [Treponema sp.]